MRLHEYSVFARFRYNDLKVGISSGNQALKRCAFIDTNPDQRADNFRVARHSGRISAIPGAFRNVQVPSHRSTQCSPLRSISRPHEKLTTYPRETSWWPCTAVVRADDAGARKNPYWAELFRACVLSSATSCWKFELGRSFSRSGSAIRPSASLYPRLMASRKYCSASSGWLAANCPAKILSP
jgi:hypothetical protein